MQIKTLILVKFIPVSSYILLVLLLIWKKSYFEYQHRNELKYSAKLEENIKEVIDEKIKTRVCHDNK